MNQKVNTEAHAVYSLVNAGQEKVDQFNCTHFVLTGYRGKNFKMLKPAHYDV